MQSFITAASRCTVIAAMVAVAAAPLGAQWVTTHEQFYLEASHNWRFRDRYAPADRLFNAFDFGHAILYETLWTRPASAARELEVKWYDRLTQDILIRPPRVPLEEAAIEIEYAKLVPEVKAMFEWAHILHRQLYDVLADDRLDEAARDREAARLIAYYKTRRDVAFSSRPKTMELMQEQPYSLAFRKDYPKFNGLIWAYHWLQVGLYEPLIVNATTDTRQAGVRSTVARFWQMLAMPPMHMPHVMPMTPAVAPRFTARYPEAAIIFDNLHSMHDVVSDILANPSVPRDRKRAEILRAARLYRDDTSFVMSVDAWKSMASHMGLENMGGPAVGFLPELPTPTVTYGAVVTHDNRTGAMTGFRYGSAVGGEHAAHAPAGAANTPDSSRRTADPHAGHPAAPGGDSTAARDTMRHMGAMHDSSMLRLHMLLLSDATIRRRILGDSAMRRLMIEQVNAMPVEHREHLLGLMREPAGASAPAATTRSKPTTTTRRARTGAAPKADAAGTKASAKAPAKPKPAATKTKAPPTKTKADPHAGHKPPS